MTLIAAFQSCGIPFLIGDVLLSDEESIIKKIHLVRPNLAISLDRAQDCRPKSYGTN